MKFNKLLSWIFALLILTLPLFVDGADAATNISFSPSSGTVGEEFDISVNINTGSDDINGISLDVTYEGNIEYSSSTAGNLGCSPIVDDGTAGVVGLTCFIPPGDSFSGQGTLSTLTFTADQDGNVSFDIENVDIAGSVEGTVSGASLTVDMDYSGSGTSGDDGDGTDGDGSLPEAGFITDNLFLIVGGLFLVIGVVIAALPETWNWINLKKKQLAKKKEKYEKKVKSAAD